MIRARTTSASNPKVRCATTRVLDQDLSARKLAHGFNFSHATRRLHSGHLAYQPIRPAGRRPHQQKAKHARNPTSTVEEQQQQRPWQQQQQLQHVRYMVDSKKKKNTCKSFSLSLSSSSPSPAPAAAASPAPAFKEYAPCPRPAFALPSVCARRASPRSSSICTSSHRMQRHDVHLLFMGKIVSSSPLHHIRSCAEA